MTVEVSVTQKLDESVVPLGTKNGIELAILRRAEKTLVKIIAKPDSSDLIDGVRIEPLQVYPDDRGFFMELARLGEGLATPMVPWKFYARQVASGFALHPSQRSKRGGRRKGQPTQCFPPRVCTPTASP